jgi:hypothetical protein
MRTTIVSDTLMQRYTGNTPGRSTPDRARPKPPSARTVRARRRANTSATLLILIVTGVFVAGLIAIIASIYLIWELLAWLL